MIGYSSRRLNRSKRKKLLWVTFGFIFFVFLLDKLNPAEDTDILYGGTNLRTVVRVETSNDAVDPGAKATGDVSAVVRTHHFVIRGFLLGIVCAYIFSRLAELLIVLVITEILVLFSMFTKGWIVVHWGVLSSMFFSLFSPAKLFSMLVSNFFSIVAFMLGIYCGKIISSYLDKPKYLRSA